MIYIEVMKYIHGDDGKHYTQYLNTVSSQYSSEKDLVGIATKSTTQSTNTRRFSTFYLL